MKKTSARIIIIILTLMGVADIYTFADASAPQVDSIHKAPENVVIEFFSLISFEAGKSPDWERMKALFIDEAVIVHRLGPNTLRTFNRQSFIDYLTMDFERANLKSSGFTEKILKTHTQIIKDIAQCYTLYEVVIPGINDDKPVNRGINSFHLIKQDGQWMIASFINEGFAMNEAIPEFLNQL